MMRFKDFLPPILTKAFAWGGGSTSWLWSLRGPSWSNTADYATMVKEGFLNAVAYACITESATAAAGVNWTLQQRPRGSAGKLQPVSDDHEAWTLLRQSAAAFRYAYLAYYYLAGNNCIARVDSGTARKVRPQELHLLVPNRALYKPRFDGQSLMVGLSYTAHPQDAQLGAPQTYHYALPALPRGALLSVDGKELEPFGQLLHLKAFAPDGGWWGQAPLMAAAPKLDQHNASGAWNTALLQNYGKRSLVLTTEQTLGAAPLADMRATLEESTGPAHAGRPMLLHGGVKVDQHGSMTPTEMDWLKGEEAAGVHICRVLNVDPTLVGFQAAQTRDNYKTARKALYTENVFPLLYMLAGGLNDWLMPLYDDRLVLGLDIDSVDAVRDERMALYAEFSKPGAWWLTPNQKLRMLGWEELGPAGDKLYVPSNLTAVDVVPPTGMKAGDIEPQVIAGRNGHVTMGGA